MIDYGEKNAFQQLANEVFNTLPVNIRKCKNKKSFTKKARSFFKDKALARILSLVYLRFSFNLSILVLVVEYVEIFVFNFHFRSPADLPYMFSIVISSTTHYVISTISLVYLLRHFTPVSISISFSLAYSEDIIFYSSGSLCAHICIVFLVQQFSVCISDSFCLLIFTNIFKYTYFLIFLKICKS